jgi:hypothetical protein
MRSVLRKFLLAAIAGACAGIGAIAVHRNRSSTTGVMVVNQPGQDSRIREIHWSVVTMRQAVDEVARRTGVHIELGAALESRSQVEMTDLLTGQINLAAYGDVPMAVNLHLHDIKVSSVLDILATNSSLVTGHVVTCYPGRDGVVTIGSRHQAPKFVRTYPIEDLLAAFRSGMTVNEAGSIPTDFFTRALTETIAPDSWVSNGGTAHESYYSGRLIVVQSARNHQRIAAFLAGLRKAWIDQRPAPELPDGLAASRSDLGPLDQVIPELPISDQTLPELIDMLAQRAGTNVVVDWPAFDTLQPQTRISGRLKNITIRSAINLLFKGSGWHGPVEYWSRDDYVQISRRDVLARSDFVLRVYDLKELVNDYLDYKRSHRFAQPAGHTAPDGPEQALDRLIHLTGLLAGADYWKDNGGAVPSPRPVGGKMMVIAAPAAHLQIAQFLSRWRHIIISPAHEGDSLGWSIQAPDSAFPTLVKRIPDLRLDRMPLRQAIMSLAHLAGTNVFLDENSLRAAGVSADAAVTLHLRNVAFHVALRNLLQAASTKLDYTITDDVILVTTQDLSEALPTTRIYDIRDLIERWISFYGTASMPLNQRNRIRFATFTSDSSDDENDTTWDAIERIVRYVQDSVEMASWKEAEGSVGSCRAFGGRLIITQTPENQLKIAAFLSALRAGGFTGH